MKKRFAALFTAIMMMIGMLSGTAYAGSSRGMAMYRDAGVIQKGDTIFFGQYDGTPIEWIVLSADEYTHSMLLLAKNKLYSSKYTDNFDDNSWENSVIRKNLRDLESTVFSAAECDAIINTVCTNGQSLTTEDRLFLLNKDEVTNLEEDILKNYGNWWLRSPGSTNGYAFCVTNDGVLFQANTSNGLIGVRPALNLNTESVIFIMQAEGMSEGEITAYTGNAWKLTLQSPEIATPVIGSITRSGNTLVVPFKEATIGDKMAVSYVIPNDTGDDILYYNNERTRTQSQGTITISLPDNLAGAEKLCFYCERVNGDKATNVAGYLTTKEIPKAYNITNGTKQEDQAQNHGYLTVSKTLAAASETVTVTVTPDTGYQLKALTAAPTAGGDPITVTQDASDETKYTFTMPACAVTVTAEFIQSATDISEATTEAVNAPVYNGGETIAPDDFEITVTLLDGTVLSRDAYTISFYPDVNCTSGTEVAVITDAGIYYALATGVLSEGYTGTTDIPMRLKVLKAALPKPVAVSTPIIFNGTEQTGVQLPNGADASRYIISGDKATEIGAYMANAALADPDNYCWSGEDGDPETADYSKPFTIDWEIRPGAKATYIVKFMVDGAVYDTQEVEEGDFAKKPADPQKAGSTFNGWFESETASGSAFDFEKTAIMADQTLYAGWTKDSAVLDGIKISKLPDKTTYIEGETFDKTGMVITAIYSDGSTKPVDSITCNPSGTLTTADTAIEISYTENGITKTAKQTIQVNTKSDPTPTPTPTPSPTPTPAPTPAPYKIIEGANQDIYQNAKSATFRSDADYSKFLYVEVDGNKLSKDDYDSRSGSTVIVLKRAFIKKLGLGVHTLKIVSNDGSASTRFTIRKLPNTGDNTPVALLTLALLAALGTIAFVMKKQRRHN